LLTDPPSAKSYTLSLHDALPISVHRGDDAADGCPGKRERHGHGMSAILRNRRDGNEKKERGESLADHGRILLLECTSSRLELMTPSTPQAAQRIIGFLAKISVPSGGPMSMPNDQATTSRPI